MCFTRINVQLYKIVSILILSVVFTTLLLQNTDRIRLVHHLLIPKVCETSLHSLESWSNLVNLGPYFVNLSSMGLKLQFAIGIN